MAAAAGFSTDFGPSASTGRFFGRGSVKTHRDRDAVRAKTTHGLRTSGDIGNGGGDGGDGDGDRGDNDDGNGDGLRATSPEAPAPRCRGARAGSTPPAAEARGRPPGRGTRRRRWRAWRRPGRRSPGRALASARIRAAQRGREPCPRSDSPRSWAELTQRSPARSFKVGPNSAPPAPPINRSTACLSDRPSARPSIGRTGGLSIGVAVLCCGDAGACQRSRGLRRCGDRTAPAMPCRRAL